MAAINRQRNRAHFLALTALLLGSTAPVHAAIVPGGDYSPIYNGVDQPWDVGGFLAVGDVSDGSLLIDQGSDVTNLTGVIGQDATATGTVTVTGTGSTWDNRGFNDTGKLFVGSFGTGTLNIENGGKVYNKDGNIGNNPTGVGTVNIAGPGSEWINAGFGFLRVGDEGEGTMTISDGGRAAGFFGTIGSSAGTTGTATVTGPGSIWESIQSLGVGALGTGTLSIENGGKATSDNGIVGFAAGSTGTATVTGAGSIWEVDRFFTVGDGGVGTLNIMPGGRVNVPGDMPIGLKSTGDGTVNLAGGTLDLMGSDVVFFDGTAAFNFTAGRLENVGVYGSSLTQQGGALAPGGPIGVTQINADYTLAGGAVEIEFGQPESLFNEFDTLDVLGNLTLAGSLEVLHTGESFFEIGDSFEIIFFSTRTGTFDSVQFPQLPGFGFGVSYLANSITLNVGLLGDLTGDGFVGIEDLNIILGAWNQTVPAGVLLQGDPSGDGFVGIEDLNFVLGNWNLGAPPPAEALALVPEPGTVGVLGITGGLFCCRRRRS